jgi:TolA-binding protein
LTMRQVGLIFALVALVSVASCAYYNIFWMAESDYEKALEVGGYDFWDPYDQPALKGDSDRLVTACIERCGKLLLLHPNSRWVDDALFLMGNCFVITGEHQNALRKYDEILHLYGSSEFAPMAGYMKAYTLIRDGSTQQGTALLKNLSEGGRSKKVKERALFLLGRTALERDDCAQAIPFFETYLTEYSDGAKVNRVRLHLAACMLEMGQAERVISVLEPLAKKQGEESLQAGLKMGEAYRGMGQNDRAIEIFTRLTEEAVEDSIRARAKMETARTMVARDEAEAAVAVLDEAAEIATAKIKDLQDEIILTKGLIQEHNLQDFDAAIEAYDKIAKSQSKYGKTANKRSAALKAVQKFRNALRDTVPDSPEDEAEHRFMLGETYLDELGLREEALTEFMTVADSLSDTRFGPQAMLRTASLFEAEDDTLARAYYSKVIALVPGSVHANFARSRIGLPLVDVVIAKPDTLVWDEGQVVGPFLPQAADSLPFVGPQELPGPGPERVSPDTTAHGRRSRPDSIGARSPIRGPTGIRFPQAQPAEADSADTAGRWSGSDTSGTYVPADSTGEGERQRP